MTKEEVEQRMLQMARDLLKANPDNPLAALHERAVKAEAERDEARRLSDLFEKQAEFYNQQSFQTFLDAFHFAGRAKRLEYAVFGDGGPL